MDIPTLPPAVFLAPICSVCSTTTDFDGTAYVCFHCQIGFHPGSMSAFYLDPDVAPCGTPCTSRWHMPFELAPDTTYECTPCALPETHAPRAHWHGCKLILHRRTLA